MPDNATNATNATNEPNEPNEATNGADAPRCSARGCRNSATVALRWRNPALHDSTRVKVWLACAEHEQHLSEFLDRRGFLLGREVLE